MSIRAQFAYDHQIVGSETAALLAHEVNGEKVETSSVSVHYGTEPDGRQVIIITGASDEAILLYPAATQI